MKITSLMYMLKLYVYTLVYKLNVQLCKGKHSHFMIQAGRRAMPHREIPHMFASHPLCPHVPPK